MTTGTFAYVLNCSIPPAGSIAQSATLTVNAMAGMGGGAAHSAPTRESLRVHRTDLVADVAQLGARQVDVHLSEPWGLVLPEKLAAVTANQRSNFSTSYDGAGSAQPASAPAVLQMPTTDGGVAFGAAAVVANSGDGFKVSAHGISAPARLLYAGTGGTIAAWSPEVDASNALLVVNGADGPVAYTGLALALSSTPGESRLYAADFRNARIDVFDTGFRKQTVTAMRFAFADPALPEGYAPFGIAVLDDLVYIAYAQRLASPQQPASGAGLGLIDVFTPGGDFITRLVNTGGVLDAPWSMVGAAAGLPSFGPALLVGNTGDGRINVFDRRNGALLGTLLDERGAPLVLPHLHGLAFGNGAAGQPRNTLFFTAGAHRGAHGWYGRLDFESR